MKYFLSTTNLSRIALQMCSVIAVVFLFLGMSICSPSPANAQEVVAEKGPAYDFAKYRTYTFANQVGLERPSKKNSQSPKTIDQSIKQLLARELVYRRLKRTDSADLLVSYTWSGPALTVPAEGRVLASEKQSTLTIDIEDRKNGLVWRVKSTFTGTPANPSRALDRAILKGFRKFGRGFSKGAGVNEISIMP
jgi:hypothetical protein